MNNTWCIILILSGYCLKAQPFRHQHYANYTTKEGLAHNNIYQPFEDSRGNIWFPSDAGVTSFDGHRFRVFNTSTKLNTNEIFRLFEDSHSRLWCLGFKGVCYIDLNTYQVVNKPYFPKETVGRMFEKDNKTLWLTSDDECYIEMRHDTCLKKRTHIFEWTKDAYGAIYGLKHTNEGILRTCRYNPQLDDFLALPMCPVSNPSISRLLPQWIQDKLYFYDLEKKSIMLLYAGRACESVAVYSGLEMTAQIQSFKIFGEELVFGTNHSAKAISLKTGKKLWEIELEHPVTGIMKDRESNYWFSTNGGGVFYFTDPYLSVCDDKPSLLGNKNIIKLFRLPDGQLGFVNADYELGILGNPKTRLRFDSEGGAIRHVSQIGEDLIISQENETCVLKKFMTQYLDKKNDAPKFNTLNPLSSGQFRFNATAKTPWKINLYQKKAIFSRDGKRVCWLGMNNFLWEIKAEQNTIRKLPISGQPARTYAACESYDGVLWWGGTGGSLGHIDLQNTAIQDTFALAGIRETISDLIALPRNFFMGSSIGGGVFLFKDKKLVGKWEKELYGTHCTRIFEQNAQNFWVATNHGVAHFYFADTNNYQEPIIRNYGNNSFPSTQINDVYVNSDSIVYLATPGGIARFHYPSMSYVEYPPTLRIAAFTKGGVRIADNCRLYYSKREISINLLGVAFERAEKMEYEYTIYRKTLFGANSIYTQNSGEIPDGQLNFSHYPYGAYRIVARCRRLTHEQSKWSEPAIFHFFVHLPYLEIALYSILSTAVLWVFLYWQRTRENLRNQLLNTELQSKSDLAKAKLEGRSLAFLAQMNMHFIYNGLNNFSRYFGKDQLREGSRYLSDFSKLLRTTLNNSKKELVTLEEEIDFLDTYMQVQIRKHANHPIHFRCDIEDGLLEQDFLIPVMLVQPFLENAVNYGLTPDMSESTITLHVKQQKSLVVFSIEDNGIGYKAHKQLNKVTQKDLHAGEIVSNRMTKYNQINGAKNHFKLIDKSDARPPSTGTIARIFICKIV